jgi:hypothetical protein
MVRQVPTKIVDAALISKIRDRQIDGDFYHAQVRQKAPNRINATLHLYSDPRAVAESILAQKGLELEPNWILSLPTVNELTQTPWAHSKR